MQADVPRWEHFEHRADIGVRGVGRTVAEAFEQAALALTAVSVDPAGVKPKREIRLTCAAADLELLLVDWLSAVVYRMATDHMVFSRFAVRIDGPALSAAARGDAAAGHAPAVEVKGVSYAELKVERDSAGVWIAQCVVDV